jgi:CDP-glycerol glycerophosphotransferase (TagB/SpsB family)
MINFVMADIPGMLYYKNVLETMNEPIMKHLKGYEITSVSKAKCINVHCINDKSYVDVVGTEGINVFINHGIADKQYRNGGKDNQFDYVLAPSESWKKVLIARGVKEEKIFIAGYPKIDYYFSEEYKHIENIDKKVLWCPTHNTNLKCTNGSSSNPKLREYIDIISEKYNFIENTHPYNNNQHRSTMFELLEADVVISDFSSMIYESLIIGKPVVFPDWICRWIILSAHGNTFEGRVYGEDIGYHADSIEELMECIEEAIEKGLDEKDIAFAEEILPTKFRGTSGKYIAEFLLELEDKL